MKKNIAIIFARGGSKGIHKKNLQLLGGKSLLEHSISHAKSSDLIHDIFVSSDDKEILEMATICDIRSIVRPKSLASDFSPEWDSWKHAVHHIETHFGNFDAMVSLPTTSPLRNNEDICNAIKTFYNTNCDSLVSISPSNKNPYFNMLRIDKYGYAKLLKSNGQKIKRRQDSPKIFDITTVCYISSPNFIKNNSSIFDGKTGWIEIPKERSLDIDDEVDLKIAEYFLKDQRLERM